MTDLDRLNSATKYPAIPTYHALGDRGVPTDTVQVRFSGPVLLTEKVDGGNGRVVLLPDGDWLVGSREEWLTARADRVPNPALGIVEALAPVAARLAAAGAWRPWADTAVACYLEVFGSRHFPAWKCYGGAPEPRIRLFDVALIPLDRLGSTVAEISRWRAAGGQDFLAWDAVAVLARAHDLETVPLVGMLPADDLPATVVEARDWLAAVVPATRIPTRAGGTGRAEGVVARDEARTMIAKLRFEDYARCRRGAVPAQSAAQPG